MQTMEMPPLSQCSPWLCMNCLSLDDKTIFVEETEKGMIELFNEHGFDCITLRELEFFLVTIHEHKVQKIHIVRSCPAS
jgi:hypothetical protein